MKILIMGLPGAGKTTLAKALVGELGATHLNADEVRANINRDLGFSLEDRIEHARRMGWLCDRIVEAGGTAVADFVCPTPETRAAFGAGFTVWVNRIAAGRFEDTNRLFVPPSRFDVEVSPDGSPEFWAETIAARIRPRFDWSRPTAFFLGHFDPLDEDIRARVVGEIERVGQACLAVCRSAGSNGSADFGAVKARIENRLLAFRSRFVVIEVPDAVSVHLETGIEVLDRGEAVARLHRRGPTDSAEQG